MSKKPFNVGQPEAKLIFDPKNPDTLFAGLQTYCPTRTPATDAAHGHQRAVVETYRVLTELKGHVSDEALVAAARRHSDELKGGSQAVEYLLLRSAIPYSDQWKDLEGDEQKRVRANVLKGAAVDAAAIRYLQMNKIQPSAAEKLIGKPGEGLRAWADRSRASKSQGLSLAERGRWAATGLRLSVSIVAYSGKRPNRVVEQAMHMIKARDLDTKWLPKVLARVKSALRAEAKAAKQVARVAGFAAGSDKGNKAKPTKPRSRT